MSNLNKIIKLENKQAKVVKAWTQIREENQHVEPLVRENERWLPNQVEPIDLDVMNFRDCETEYEYSSNRFYLKIGVSNLPTGDPREEKHWDRYVILVSPKIGVKTRTMRYAAKMGGGLPPFDSFVDVVKESGEIRYKDEDPPNDKNEFEIEVTRDTNGKILIWVIGDLDTGGGGQ